MSNQLICVDPSGLSKSFTVNLGSTANKEKEEKKEEEKVSFHFHLLEFANKVIINISIDGILDSSFRAPVPTRKVMNYESRIDLDDDDEEKKKNDGSMGFVDTSGELELIVGNYSNMKISIVAAQVAKLVQTRKPKETIVTIGSRWFGNGEEVEDSDFERLMFVLENVKKLL